MLIFEYTAFQNADSKRPKNVRLKANADSGGSMNAKFNHV